MLLLVGLFAWPLLQELGDSELDFAQQVFWQLPSD